MRRCPTTHSIDWIFSARTALFRFCLSVAGPSKYNLLRPALNHNPPNDRPAPDIVSAEREILRRLCSSDPNAAIDRFVRDLLSYSWREPEHTTVFEAIRALAIRRGAGISWREELPAQATRMGFPDVEWSNYFGAADSSEPALDEMISQLLRCDARQRES